MGPKNVIELGFRSAIAQISDMTMSLGLNRCLDVRSARLYGQFSLDKTLTLQAGSTVPTSASLIDIPTCPVSANPICIL